MPEGPTHSSPMRTPALQQAHVQSFFFCLADAFVI